MNVALNKLTALGISQSDLERLEILLLPENLGNDGAHRNTFDAQDSVDLGKGLKMAGVMCANSYDLGLNVPTKERRSDDIWFGEVFILKDAVLPVVTGVIASIVAPIIQHMFHKKDKRAPSGQVHIEVTVSKKDGVNTLNYCGDPQTLLKILESMNPANDKPKLDGERTES